MGSNRKIRPEQLARAKKLLQDLPEKNDGKTRTEAAEFLERDFRKALEKGYSPKELSAILKNEGIIIPAYLVKKYLAQETAPELPRKSPKIKPKKEAVKPAASGQFSITPDTPDEEL